MAGMTALGIFAIMFLMTLSLISFVGNFNNTQMQSNFARINCPTPLYAGADLLNGTIVYPPSQFNYGTFYHCEIAPHTNPPTVETIATYKNYNATTFNAFPSGWFLYVGDTIGTYMNKVSAMENIIGTILNPASFNVSGITISNLSLFGQTFVFAIYIVMYILVGVFIYKAVSPFVDG